MILTDREMQAAISSGEIIINPQPSEDAYSSTTVDLTLGSDIRLWVEPTSGVEQAIRPHAQGYSYTSVAERHTTSVAIGEHGFDLKPGMFILGWTRESIGLPTRSQLAARVEGKSSLARLGMVVHLTAPTIQSGFGATGKDTKGQSLQLEICNHGKLTVRLDVGMRICQLIFEQTLGTPAKGYSGQFSRQGPARG